MLPTIYATKNAFSQKRLDIFAFVLAIVKYYDLLVNVFLKLFCTTYIKIIYDVKVMSELSWNFNI